MEQTKVPGIDELEADLIDHVSYLIYRLLIHFRPQLTQAFYLVARRWNLSVLVSSPEP
jgi:hypothetical protein